MIKYLIGAEQTHQTHNFPSKIKEMLNKETPSIYTVDIFSLNVTKYY